MLASACVPEPEAMIASAGERFVSPYVEVETYAGSRLPLRVRRASTSYVVAREHKWVVADLR
jgi:hypothetical protein